MTKRPVITGVITILIIVVILYFLPDIYRNVQLMAHNLDINTRFFLIVIGFELLLSLVGFLSMRNWFEFFRSGNIKVGKGTLIIGILLLLLGVFPTSAWVMTFGLGGHFKTLLYTPATHYPICVLAGVVIGRAFGHKDGCDKKPSEEQASDT